MITVTDGKTLKWMIDELKNKLDDLIERKEQCFEDAKDLDHMIADTYESLQKYEKRLENAE